MKIMFIMYSGNQKLNEVFKEYRPDIVYHAAIHKHVPLMGVSPIETYKTAMVALHRNIRLRNSY